MVVQRLSGWLVVGARTLVLLVLAFAPLVCLRVCQLRHALVAHEQHILCDVPTLPTNDSLLHDVQQLMSALTEFIPAVALIAFAMVALPRGAAAAASDFTPLRRVPVPPPRPCGA